MVQWKVNWFRRNSPAPIFKLKPEKMRSNEEWTNLLVALLLWDVGYQGFACLLLQQLLHPRWCHSVCIIKSPRRKGCVGHFLSDISSFAKSQEVCCFAARDVGLTWILQGDRYHLNCNHVTTIRGVLGLAIPRVGTTSWISAGLSRCGARSTEEICLFLAAMMHKIWLLSRLRGATPPSPSSSSSSSSSSAAAAAASSSSAAASSSLAASSSSSKTRLIDSQDYATAILSDYTTSILSHVASLLGTMANIVAAFAVPLPRHFSIPESQKHAFKTF